MQDCYPSKRATNPTKVLFHLSTPVGIACTAKSLSKRVAVPATIPFVTPHKTNANLSRLFLPPRFFRRAAADIDKISERRKARGYPGRTADALQIGY